MRRCTLNRFEKKNFYEAIQISKTFRIQVDLLV